MARVLTIIFGALPATYMSLWALLGVLAGIASLLTLNWVFALATLPLSVAGLFGTAALWAVAFDRRDARVVKGLFAGVAAMLFIIIWIGAGNVISGIATQPLLTVFVSPLPVGAFWLVALLAFEPAAFETRRDDDGSTDE